MCSVKINVLDFTEKGNDYRCEERELATLHTFVSWRKEMLFFFYCFFLRMYAIIIFLFPSKAAIYERNIQAFLRINFKGKKPNTSCQ